MAAGKQTPPFNVGNIAEEAIIIGEVQRGALNLLFV
jgi:hypothetical protein